MIKLLCSFVLVFALLFAARPVSAETKPITDDALYDQIKIKLANDQDIKGGALEIVIKDGNVILKGEIDSEKKKDKATRVTRKMRGVKSVDNQLKVVPR